MFMSFVGARFSASLVPSDHTPDDRRNTVILRFGRLCPNQRILTSEALPDKTGTLSDPRLGWMQHSAVFRCLVPRHALHFQGAGGGWTSSSTFRRLRAFAQPCAIVPHPTPISRLA